MHNEVVPLHSKRNADFGRRAMLLNAENSGISRRYVKTNLHLRCAYHPLLFNPLSRLRYNPTHKEGAVAQSVERATPGEEVPGTIPVVAARSQLVGSVSLKCDRLRQKSWSPSTVSCVAARKIVRRSVMGPVRDITQ